LPAQSAASRPADDVLAALGTTRAGLSSKEAAERLSQFGPNAVRTHRARALPVLAGQFKSALLVLLLATATISFFLGECADAAIIGVILAASVGLGFVNE
jgi:P-type Mg2+ transporter